MTLDIVKVPDPILRHKTPEATSVTPDVVDLAKNMLETMRQQKGVGLAAPQINRSVRLIVLENLVDGDKLAERIPTSVLLNPKIIKKSKTIAKSPEACLSIPGVTGVVERAKKVTVKAINIEGNDLMLEADGFFSFVLQHEIDHLNGVLFTDRLKHYRIVFWSSSEEGLPALRALAKHAQLDLVGIVTETDKPAGRGHRLTPNPIKKEATELKIPVLEPTGWNGNSKNQTKADSAKDNLSKLRELKPDFNVVISYGKILPPEVLATAKILNLNVHFSLLPKYRGAAPVQGAIMNGEKKTGISLMLMAEEMDAGPILEMYQFNIKPDETAGELKTRLADASALYLIDCLENILADKAEMYEQKASLATFTSKISSDQAKIDWQQPAKKIVNFIRAMSPKPGAVCQIDDLTIKLLRAHLADEKIIIDQLQLPGRRVMSQSDFRNGYPKLYRQLQRLADNQSKQK